MFNLGDVDLEDIPDGFPVGTNTFPMKVTKSEVIIPANPAKNDNPEIFKFKRNLKVTFEVSDEDSPYYEQSTPLTITLYDFSGDPEVFEDLSSTAKAQIRKNLSFYRSRMRQFGFSDHDINNNNITAEMIVGNEYMVPITRATDDSWPQIGVFTSKESAIED